MASGSMPSPALSPKALAVEGEKAKIPGGGESALGAEPDPKAEDMPTPFEASITAGKSDISGGAGAGEEPKSPTGDKSDEDIYDRSSEDEGDGAASKGKAGDSSLALSEEGGKSRKSSLSLISGSGGDKALTRDGSASGSVHPEAPAALEPSAGSAASVPVSPSGSRVASPARSPRISPAAFPPLSLLASEPVSPAPTPTPAAADPEAPI